MAQREGSATGRPSALDRLGHDNPILSTASPKCSAVSRAVPSARSCSCGCWRIRRSILFSIGVMLSQIHKGSGLPQSAHSGTSSTTASALNWALDLALDSGCFDIRPLYAARGSAATRLVGRSATDDTRQDGE